MGRFLCQSTTRARLLPRLLAAAISASAFSLALSLRITRSADMPRMRAAAIQKIADVIARSKSVAFLTGAGVSVSAGIPDFRSPGGMYDTLRPELLTATDAQRRAMSVDPTAVVSWDIFGVNQLPYLELRKPFIEGAHSQKSVPWNIYYEATTEL